MLVLFISYVPKCRNKTSPAESKNKPNTFTTTFFSYGHNAWCYNALLVHCSHSGNHWYIRPNKQYPWNLICLSIFLWHLYFVRIHQKRNTWAVFYGTCKLQFISNQTNSIYIKNTTIYPKAFYCAIDNNQFDSAWIISWIHFINSHNMSIKVTVSVKYTTIWNFCYY